MYLGGSGHEWLSSGARGALVGLRRGEPTENV